LARRDLVSMTEEAELAVAALGAGVVTTITLFSAVAAVMVGQIV